jgi:hypothetical protein
MARSPGGRTMIVMLELECWRASSSHDVRWLNVSRLNKARYL